MNLWLPKMGKDPDTQSDLDMSEAPGEAGCRRREIKGGSLQGPQVGEKGQECFGHPILVIQHDSWQWAEQLQFCHWTICSIFFSCWIGKQFDPVFWTPFRRARMRRTIAYKPIRNWTQHGHFLLISSPFPCFKKCHVMRPLASARRQRLEQAKREATEGSLMYMVWRLKTWNRRIDGWQSGILQPCTVMPNIDE